MGEIIKTIEQIEDIFRLMVLKIFGLDPEAAENQGRVRFPFGSNLGKSNNDTAPLKSKTQDICIVTVTPKDDLYNRQRDRRVVDYGGQDLTLLDEHTDVHEVTFCNYGEHAYECARDIRDGLFRPDIRDFLNKNNFALVADVSAIRRVPELFDGEWWNRVDITASFNEFVRRESTITTIEQIDVEIKYVSNKKEKSKKINSKRSDLENV